MAKKKKAKIKNEVARHDDYPRDKDCEQTVNVCCSEKKPEYHYLETKQECCCYEISMRKVRVTDTNIDGKLELMISGYANQHEAVFPGLGSWVVVSKKWGWVHMNKIIGEFKIKKGSSLQVRLGAEAVELDIWSGGSAEIGSSQQDKHIWLSCGRGVQNAVVEVPLNAVKTGKTRHKIEVEFCAYEKSCCC